jgi:Cu(I)/Ag(I) efflux system membrane fusion protein
VFEVPAFDRDWVRVGQEVQITIGTKTLVAPVTFIDPNLNPSSRGAWVRAEFENLSTLPRGALAEGRVATGASAVLAVPRSAILDAGTGPVAWVERGASSYELRALLLGRRGDTLVEVLAGLVEGERVVVQAALLIDAQAQLTRQDRR